MKWTEEHDVLILRELMVLQPWKHRKGTSERGEDWQKLAVSLNAISHPQFHVTQRSVRYHYSAMEKRKKRKGHRRRESLRKTEKKTEPVEQTLWPT